MVLKSGSIGCTMNWKPWIALLSFAQILVQGRCQLSDNTPPYMYLERNWKIPDNEPIGSRIAEAHGADAEGGNLTYGLEPLQFFGSDKPPDPLPFRIDPNTGVVYLNDTLKGKGGQDLHLYVTVSDGQLTPKTEVYVNILNSSSPYKPSHNRPSFSPPPGSFNPGVFNGFSGFNPVQPPVPQNMSPKISTNMPKNLNNYNNPPPNIANNPPPMPSRPYFQQKTYPERSKRPMNNNTQEVTPLRPVKITNLESPSNSLENTILVEKTTETSTNKDTEKEDNENELSPLVKTRELDGTVVSIISVCAVFFTVGVIAVVFRKKIAFGKQKDTKDDMRKESSGGITLREEPSINLHEWRGPRAFSNRYEPWQREGDHPELSNEDSVSVKNADRWEFPRHRLKFFNILGEGAFGQVWKCEALDLEGKDTGPTIVAVKTLKENANEKEKSDLISELQVMKMLEPHANVVKLLGCCTEKEPIFLIMEFISHGKLQSYLRNSRAERYYNNMHGKSKTLTSRDLTSFCYQVAKGMEFLSANGIIHRDLAARNILITEEHTCKVADFGFARDVIASHIYERKSEGRLPIRWMAPESLYDNIFSVKSDVWSFGVLIWEVVTLGSTPYPGLSAAEVMRKIIHRDLAARNILITEEHTCKVADFGFARDVIASHIYERKSEGRLPIRWMAPESLYDNIFSVKSDVWSFGVLIWEVVTLGSTPYPGLSAAEVMRKVRDGYRLDKPDHCRRELYNIMYYCWDKDSKERPSFTECVGLLEKLIMTETDYIELERFPDHSYYNMMSLSGEKL